MKIALLGHETFSNYSYRMLQPILADKNFEIVLMIIHQPKPQTIKQQLISSWKKGRRGYLLVIITQTLIKKAKTKFKARNKKSTDFNSSDFFSQRQAAIIKTPKLYTDEIVEKVESYHADVLILIDFHRIVKDKLIKAFPQGTLSYHYGNMRKYRGQPPAFWELYNGEKEMGVTVQKINAGIDCGEPIEEMTITFGKKRNSIALIDKWVDKNCPAMMYNALKKVQAGYQPPQIKEYGKLYTVPTLRQWLAFQFKQIFRSFF